MFGLLKNLLRHKPARIDRRTSRRVRPFLEVLEGRCTPATFTVNVLGDLPDINQGDSVAQDANGNTSLRAAIQEAKELGGTHTINFSSTLNGTIYLENVLPTIDNALDLTIQGPGASVITVARSNAAQNPFRIFNIDTDATCEISDLTISKGTGTAGAGVNNYGQLTLVDCVITENNAGGGGGGGISNGSSGTMWIEGCTISNNVAEVGGGIYNAGTMYIYAYSVISCNEAQSITLGGGGIFNQGSLEIYGSTTITDNDASSGYGGGIYSDGILSVSGGQIDSNRADRYGGGVYLTGGTTTPTFTSVDIENNSADKGGGVYVDEVTSAIFTSCNVLYNTATTKGPGICYRYANTVITDGGNYQSILQD